MKLAFSLSLFIISAFTYAQPKAEAFLHIYASSEEIVEGECTIVNASVMVKETNQVSMRFHDIASQVLALNRTIHGSVPFFGNSYIVSISGAEVTYQGERYTEYKLLHYGICPDSDVKIPVRGLDMLKMPDSSILTLTSKELNIKVNDAPKVDLIGDFQLEILSTQLKDQTGDTSVIEYEIAGFGNLFPFRMEDLENEDFRMKTATISFKDSVYTSSFYHNRKKFKTEIIHKREGTIHMNDFVNIKSYSPRLKKITEHQLPIKIEVSGETKALAKEDYSNLVILLDNSQSMELEDYVPTRFDAAKEFANSLLKEKCNPFYLISGQPIKIDQCNVTDSMLYVNKFLGTAIGNALWSAIDDLKSARGKKGIVLITDGDATSGNVNTLLTARIAKEYGIKIFAVGVGSTGLVRYGVDFFGRPRYINQTFDDEALRKIAEVNGGVYYRLPKDSKEEILKIKSEILEHLE